MLNFLALRLFSMRRIFMVMIAFGLTMGLVFPLIVGPFVTWDPDRKIFFRFACLAAGLAVGSFCYYLVKITLFQRNMLLAQRKAELEEAKERFSSLTHNAIQKQDWNVSLEDEHVPVCWERKKCNATECPAFGKIHLRCWLVAGTLCGGKIQGKFAQKLGDCTLCEVYQEAVGQNPIFEIGENFNSLMLAVREKEEMLAVANAELQEQYAELEILQKKTREMADTDMLTGLYNRGHFQKYLQREVAKTKRYERHLSLLMIDLDHFKLVNDKHGHQKGDAVLRAVGKLLKKEIRDIDYAARYGGEEFIILMPEINGTQAVIAADRLRCKIKELADGLALPAKHIGGSFGVADQPACASDGDALISAADRALLFAKRNGRNQVAYFRDLSEVELRESNISFG